MNILFVTNIPVKSFQKEATKTNIPTTPILPSTQYGLRKLQQKQVSMGSQFVDLRRLKVGSLNQQQKASSSISTSNVLQNKYAQPYLIKSSNAQRNKTYERQGYFQLQKRSHVVNSYLKMQEVINSKPDTTQAFVISGIVNQVMQQPMPGGSAVLDSPTKNIDTLERIFNDESAKTDSGGGDGFPPGNGGDERPEGGGDGDERRITAKEKYGIKGMFAKECLLFNLSMDSIQKLRDDPIRELKEIQRVRQLLQEDLECFLPSFDLQTKKIHYYCQINTIKEKLQQTRNFMDFNDIKRATITSIFDEEPPSEQNKIFLNGTFSYVVKNIIVDNEEETLNDKSSFLSQVIQKNGRQEMMYDYQTQQEQQQIIDRMIEKQYQSPKYMFVPNHLVYYLVGQQLLLTSENDTESDLEYVQNGFERQVKKQENQSKLRDQKQKQIRDNEITPRELFDQKQKQVPWNIFDSWKNFLDKNIEINPDIKGDIGDILK